MIQQTSTRKGVDGEPSPKPMTTRQLLYSPGVSMALFISYYASFLGFAFTAGKQSLSLSLSQTPPSIPSFS